MRSKRAECAELHRRDDRKQIGLMIYDKWLVIIVFKVIITDQI